MLAAACYFLWNINATTGVVMIASLSPMALNLLSMTGRRKE
jgi:hypothetical protein